MTNSQTPEQSSSSRRDRVSGFYGLVQGCVVVAVCVLAIFEIARNRSEHAPNSLREQLEQPNVAVIEPAPPIDMKALRKKAWERIQIRINETDKASAAEINKSLGTLAEFFSEKKTGSPGFAEAILSLRGKWEFIVAKLPFTDTDGHRKFLTERFESRVFSPEQLKTTIQSVVASYVSNVEGLDNELLVAVRADLGDLVTDKGTPLLDGQEQFARQFKKMVEDITPVIERDLAVFIIREYVTLNAADIAASIAIRIAVALSTRLGISSGILAAGSLGSLETLGMTIVAAIILDIGADWLLKVAGIDAERQVADKVNETLDGIRAKIVDGIPEAHQAVNQLRELEKSDPEPDVRAECKAAADRIERSGNLGLQRELASQNRLRAGVRREALRRLILEGVDP